jgi:NAD(P)-dependent dehydrogenase (short-subunit alcohol dehydrogenase family)
MDCQGRSLARLDGVVAVVTGATRGIGRPVAERLAALGARVVLPVRNPAQGELVAEAIQQRNGHAEVVRADLASLASVRSAAEEIARRHPRIGLLINNAGIITRRREVTADGLERQFAVNHLAAFLMTLRLLDALRAGAPARIVNVSSGAHAGQRLEFDDLMSERDYRRDRVYGQTKLANILFSHELARRLEGSGVTANAVHPGVVATGLLSDYLGMPAGRRSFGITPERGAEPILYLAASPEVAGISGHYFDRCTETRSSAASYDEAAARRLWEESLRLVGHDPLANSSRAG